MRHADYSQSFKFTPIQDNPPINYFEKCIYECILLQQKIHHNYYISVFNEKSRSITDYGAKNKVVV